MSKYAYRAKNPMGQTVSGTVDALDTHSVAELLRTQGLFVIDIKTGFSTSFLSALSSRFTEKIGFSDITNFTRQIAVMISTGLTITESLAVLRNQAHNEAMRRLVEHLIVDVEGGASFSKALGRHKNVFSNIYIAVVGAGEASGLLDKMLVRLADTLEHEREFRGKTKGALLYPLIIMVGMGIVMTIMMIFVVPQLSSLYEQLQAELPLPTKIVIAISNFFVNFWYIAIAMLVGSYIFFHSWKKTESGKYTMDSIALHIPAWGTLQSDINIAEFTRTFGLLVGSGTPIIDALQNVGGASRNIHFSEAVTRIAGQIEKGVSLGSAFAKESVFPPLIAQMARVGEETGKIDEVLVSISNYYEAEADRRVKALTTLLEPIILVVLGVGVGFLVISVILPIYNLTQVIK